MPKNKAFGDISCCSVALRWAKMSPDLWDNLWDKGVEMAKRRKKGYSKRSRSEHPNVSIQIRRGVAVLRYPMPGTNKRTQVQETVYIDDNRTTVTSRAAAKPFAIAKSIWWEKEERRYRDLNSTINPQMTWEQLQAAHRKELVKGNRSEKTLKSYEFMYGVINAWEGRPSRPAYLRRGHLADFILYLRERSPNYAEASIRSILVHFKAMLNFGRLSDDACIMLSDVDMKKGFDAGRKSKPLPVAFTTAQLRSILKAASDYDAAHSRTPVFPFLCFLMMSGSRRSEAARLRWLPSTPNAEESWCELEGNCLLIWGNKTRVQRVLPLRHRRRLRLMLEVMREMTDPTAAPFVFGGEFELGFGDKARSGEEKHSGRNFKYPLKKIKEASGVDFRLKDLRSTSATFLVNSIAFRNAYELAGQIGNSYPVLAKHYANRRELPPDQKNADDVAQILGISDMVDAWIEQHTDATGLAEVVPIKEAG